MSYNGIHYMLFVLLHFEIGMIIHNKELLCLGSGFLER